VGEETVEDGEVEAKVEKKPSQKKQIVSMWESPEQLNKMVMGAEVRYHYIHNLDYYDLYSETP
jgi:hypothetical protein